MYKAITVDTSDQLDGLAGSWNALLALSKDPTVFNTFAWARCWLQVYGQPDYALKIILVYAGDDLVALLPLYIQAATGTCWFIGSGEPEEEEVASEYLDFIIHQNHWHDKALADCINGQLDEINKKARLILVNCRANAYAAGILRSHTRALYRVTGAEYRLPIQETFSATAQVFSKRHLKNIRQYLSRFDAAPDVQYTPIHADNFDDDWQTLQLLHQKDWTARGKNGAFHSAKFSRFHALMHTAHPEARQVFATLTKGAETLAIHHFYVFGNSYYFYLAGTEKTRDSRLSPGVLLHALTMQELSGRSVQYDFLKGAANDSYKGKFCKPEGEFYTITVFENSMRGRLRLLLARLKRFVSNIRTSASRDEVSSINHKADAD